MAPEKNGKVESSSVVGAEEVKKDMRAYSSQFTPGMGPSMIVGLPQNWPLLGPLPFYTTVPHYAPPLALSYNGTKLFNLCLNGHTYSSFSSLIQDFGDKWIGPGSQAAATLANQLFSDNNELVYVLITDAASYPITSKPELWQLSKEDEKQQNQNQVHFSLPNNGNNPLEKTMPISFSTLFNVGQEIFALFVFSPTQILFTLETQAQQGLASVFYHGLSQVSVSVSQNPRIINILFLEKAEFIP